MWQQKAGEVAALEIPTDRDDVELLWQELRSATGTIARQAAILTEVVNALRGPPPEGTQWPHHNAGELARDAQRKLADIIRRIEISHAMNEGDDETVDRLTREEAEALGEPDKEA